MTGRVTVLNVTARVSYALISRSRSRINDTVISRTILGHVIDWSLRAVVLLRNVS